MEEKIDWVVSALLHHNCADEQMAQAGYQELIAAIQASVDAPISLKDKTIAVIREIQGDEFNHSCKLMALAREWDKVEPSRDDLDEALATIGGQ